LSTTKEQKCRKILAKRAQMAILPPIERKVDWKGTGNGRGGSAQKAEKGYKKIHLLGKGKRAGVPAL